MNYWLLKSDPDEYGYDDLARDRRTMWEGVRNNQALQHIRRMGKGDLALVYHSGKEKAVVAVAEIVRGPYPDPDAGDEKIVVVDVRAKKRLKQPVSLAAIKQDKRFTDFPLVRQPRLSVMPVSEGQWGAIMAMAGG